MPTGPLHARVVNSVVNGELTQDAFDCRCLEGEDHIEGPASVYDEQDEIVDRLTGNIETIDDDEFNSLYSQLDARRQMQIDTATRNFADGAIGSTTWDSDEGWRGDY